MKYTSKAFKIKLDNGKTVFVRATSQTANIPGVGRVNLPEYLKDQSDIQTQISQAKKSKKPTVEIQELENKLSLPGLVFKYLDSKSQSSAFVISETQGGFPVSEEEAIEDVESLKKENAALLAKIGELTAMIEKPESDPSKK